MRWPTWCAVPPVAFDIKLKKCPTCDLVRYCSDTCQKEHSPKHKRGCKKRATELRDEILFKQPESTHDGDCPICFLPLPLDPTKSSISGCCSKVICYGCNYANVLRKERERLQLKCPFCRKPIPKTDEEANKHMMKRVEMNDPVAMCREGGEQYTKGNYSTAFEYLTKAAGLGDIESHFQLSNLYRDAEGVEKDEKKQLYHWKRLQLAGTPELDTILETMRREVEGSREQ